MQPAYQSIPHIPFGALRRFARGALILDAASHARSVYLVQSGQVRVFVLTAAGDVTTFAVLGPGQLFGIEAMLGHPVYGTFVDALTAVEAWSLPAERLRDRSPHDPALLSLVVGAVGQRLALAEALLRDVALLPVAERIPNALARLRRSFGGERPQLTHEHLAGLIGARRETVSRAVAALPVSDG